MRRWPTAADGQQRAARRSTHYSQRRHGIQLDRVQEAYTEADPCTKDAWLQHPYYDVPNFHRIVVHGSTFPMEWLKR